MGKYKWAKSRVKKELFDPNSTTIYFCTLNYFFEGYAQCSNCTECYVSSQQSFAAVRQQSKARTRRYYKCKNYLSDITRRFVYTNIYMRSVYQINSKQYNSGSKCIFYCNLCLPIYMNMVSYWAASFFCRWLGDWQKYITFFDHKTKYISLTNCVAALTKISHNILLLEFRFLSILYMDIEVGSKERKVS